MKLTNSRLKALYGYSDDAPTPSPTPLTLIVGSLGVNFLYFYIVLPTYSVGDNESSPFPLLPPFHLITNNDFDLTQTKVNR